LRNVLAHNGFDWLAEGPEDWRRPPLDWYQTRYEAKALGEGRRPIYLRFARRA
jgi:tRNA (guanine-N7-)-methyltransferase